MFFSVFEERSISVLHRSASFCTNFVHVLPVDGERICVVVRDIRGSPPNSGGNEAEAKRMEQGRTLRSTDGYGLK